MAVSVDLRELITDRPDDNAPQRCRRRHLVTRYLIPLGVVVGFGAVIGWSAKDSLRSSRPVTVVPVIVVRAEIQPSGTPLFQAAGWVEPRPAPVMVTAMVEGMVDQILVVAGQEVTAGQTLATLVDADARIALGDAEATLQLREAEIASVDAALAAARAQAEHPVHLEAALADAESLLAKVKTEQVNLPFAIRAAESRLQMAKQDLEGKKNASAALPGRSIQRAQSEFDSATAALEELRSRGPSLEAESAASGRKSDALRRQLELKTEETWRVAEADAGVHVAAARYRQAELAVQAARLRLERMTLRAPLAGRVLTLNAHPGRRVTGLTPASEQDSATVLTLYDPGMLQVRADVRLEDVPQVQPGQPAQISCAVLSQPLSGQVLTAISIADIQKNTLQVKVAIDVPPPVMKPDMLVQVTFLAPEKPKNKLEGSEEPLRLLVPRQLVETSDGGIHVWVADRVNDVARLQAIKLGQAGTEQLVEVVEGLNSMDKLIAGGREGLKAGERITVTGEDTTLGITDQGPGAVAEPRTTSELPTNVPQK